MKLERYGKAFLEVIAGAQEEVHPARRRLAGRDAGGLFDKLQETQVRLSKGESGFDTYLNCTSSTLSKIAQQRPRNLQELEIIQGMGAKKAERFGLAFLDVIVAE